MSPTRPVGAVGAGGAGGVGETIAATLTGLGLAWAEPEPGLFSVRLPGSDKLATDCALQVGAHGLSVRAFVARRPEQDHGRVYRWLLERNLRLSMVAFSVDTLGDIYLTGRLPLGSIDASTLDTLLGVVAETADSSFNPILTMGFADSIAAEWVWRRSRGESTANLAAFSRLDPDAAVGGPQDPDDRRHPTGIAET